MKSKRIPHKASNHARNEQQATMQGMTLYLCSLSLSISLSLSFSLSLFLSFFLSLCLCIRISEPLYLSKYLHVSLSLSLKLSGFLSFLSASICLSLFFASTSACCRSGGQDPSRSGFASTLARPVDPLP